MSSIIAFAAESLFTRYMPLYYILFSNLCKVITIDTNIVFVIASRPLLKSWWQAASMLPYIATVDTVDQAPLLQNINFSFSFPLTHYLHIFKVGCHHSQTTSYSKYRPTEYYHFNVPYELRIMPCLQRKTRVCISLRFFPSSHVTVHQSALNFVPYMYVSE